MSLDRYCEKKRLIVLNSTASAYEAARAFESNHIGAVIVQDSGEVVGIVTDRDLALRVTGAELDPKQTRLRDVMTPGPATLTREDTEAQAAKLMHARHVRRIPIVDDGRVVGIVTLDDLILSGAIDLETAADIIEAGLSEPRAAKPAGVTHPLPTTRMSPEERAARHAARANQTFHEFTARLLADLGVESQDYALTAFEVVAQGLVKRLTRDEAADFVAQLPSKIRDRLLQLPAGPDRSVTLESLEREMARRLDVDPERARDLVRRVAASLPHFISRGELDDVVNQLPKDMKAAFAQPC